MDQLQKHRQLIRLRIGSLERRKKVLKPHERWPTVKAVRHYQEWRSNFPVLGQLPASSKTKDTKSPAKLHQFHFPISRDKDRPMFSQFSNLPPELRIQIWEYTRVVPKFIEAQFCTQFFQPVFVCNQRNVLFSVCRESRAIAVASIPDTVSLKALILKPRLLPQTMFLGNAQNNSRGQEPRSNQILHFNPEQDTIFLRSLDNYRANDLVSIIDRFHGLHNIQHLAVPLEQRGVPTRREWHRILNSMPALKTLTFMLGSKEKSWRGTQRGIELRDFEQWFVDGRSRDVCRGNGGKVDVKDVESYMRTTTAAIGGLYEIGSKSGNRTVNVRVVAWKRGGRA